MTAVLVALLIVISGALAVTLWMLARRRQTAPKSGDEALEARYHQLIDRLPATVAVWNTATMSVSFVSSQVEQLTGEPAAMWLGEEGMLRFRSRVHPDDLADPDRWRSNDDPRPSQFRWTRSDGHTIWIRESQSPVSGTDMLGFLSDVTAEVAAAADLAEQRQRYQTLVEQLPVATYVTSADETLLYVSPQVESILGISVEQALEEGRDLEGRRPWFHPDDHDYGVDQTREMYEGRADGYNFRTRMVHADGSVRHARLIGRPLEDESGTIVAHQGVLIDITDEVNARAERDAHLLRYQTLIEQLPVVTYLVGADDTLLYISPQVESLRGISVERALEEGRTPEGRRSWFHPDDYDRGLAQAHEMYAGRSDGYTFEGREFHADGSERHVRMIVRALKDESGTVVASQGVTIDVTDEVNARAERDAHLLRYQNLIEQLPVATYVFDTDGHPVYVSPQVEKILGITVEQAMTRGRTPEARRSWFHPDDREWTLAKGRDVFEGRSDGYNVAARMIHTDGSIRHVRLIARALKDANGKLIGVQGILIDSTDEVNARAERDAHLLRYETLIEQTPVVTYVTDEQGVLAYVSPQIERMLGYSPDELVRDMEGTRRQSLIYHADDVAPMLECHAVLLDGSVDAAEVPVRMVARDGTLRYAQMIARSIRTRDGAVVGTQGVIVDLTELRTAQQRSQEVLGALVTAAEDERARIATELHDDTVQVMTALLMHVRMLVRTDPGLQRFEQLLSEALERTRRLMFELRPHVLERSGLGAAIDELAVEGPWQEAEVAIDVARQTDTLEAVAYRALRELIINARKHSRASRLSVRGWQAEGRLRFVVEDDGVGFDVGRALDRDRMRMHVGLDATGERLNLAGGSLDIESSPGAGARIELSLPAQPRANGDSAT